MKEGRISLLHDRSGAVIHAVSDYLSLEEVVCIARVCRAWHESLESYTDEGFPVGALAARKAELRNFVFGARQWERYFGEVERIPLPLELSDILNERDPFETDKKVKDTFRLFLLPRKVNSHPLTLNSLEKLVQSPREDSGGYSAPCHYREEASHQPLRNKPVNTACWILMRKQIIPGSQGKSFEEQQQMIGSCPGYTVPGVFECAVAGFTHYVQNGEGLINCFSRCQEEIRGVRLSVGSFFNESEESANRHFDEKSSLGIVAQRKFYDPRQLSKKSLVRSFLNRLFQIKGSL